MKWIEAKVIFNFKDKQLAVDLISNLFYDLELTGVVIETPEIDSLEDWGNDAIVPEKNAVIGYLPCDEKLEKRQKFVEENLLRLEEKNGIECKIVYSDINQEDWAQTWKTYFRPERITENIVVKPTWREYIREHDEIVLEIDPGMAFGTGTHPTTRMCITMIEKYLKRNGMFLDIGTGSGILMIAAAKLGEIEVWGTDNDNVAMETAYKNLIQNRISESNFKILAADLVDQITEQFDLVAANLTTKTILILLESVERVLVQDGIFVCSGILEKDKDEVLKKMKDLSFDLIEILAKEEWLSIACRSKRHLT
ncbi:MAG: 50S ribosomal protein L11 methyltransferase [Desulfobacteraceae bacterium]|nr:MAG: 50S ribosomal protein L11 methyltransferase [Desulfobacteraceae bacterium]